MSWREPKCSETILADVRVTYGNPILTAPVSLSYKLLAGARESYQGPQSNQKKGRLIASTDIWNGIGKTQ